MSKLKENKLIAEFMGGKYNTESRMRMAAHEIWLPIHGVEDVRTLNYDINWDWLMPVIAKIEQSRKDIYDVEEFLQIRDELITGRINHTFDAVVNFIKIKL